MTKEQKHDLRLLEKDIQKTIKRQGVLKSLKMISNCVYCKMEEFFIYAVYFVQLKNKGYELVLRINIKPYVYDDLFWELLNMADNNQKDSLRANGAFACPSLELKEIAYEIVSLDSLEELVSNAMLEFKRETELFINQVHKEYGDFNSYILEQSGILDERLLKMLAYICHENYSDAMKLATSEIELGNRGGYSNEGKDIYKHILNYCMIKM
jgi:hypothetical protein